MCDSDTMLDPASSVEMVKVLEEDPMVGGVGGDVQVGYETTISYSLEVSYVIVLEMFMLNLQRFACQFLPRF